MPIDKAAYANIFKTVAAQKAVASDFAPPIQAGNHILALKGLEGNITKVDKILVLEGEFCVVQSNNPEMKPGQTVGEPWFIGATGVRGEYANERNQKFIKAVQASVGDPRTVEETGEGIVDGHFNGVLLKVTTVQVMDDDGRTPAVGKKGQYIYNSSFAPIPGQTSDSVKASAAQIEVLERTLIAGPAGTASVAAAPAAGGFGGFGGAPAAAPATAPAAAPAATPLATQPASTGFSGFGGFGK